MSKVNKKKRSHEALREKAKAQGQLYVSRNDKCPCGSGKKAKRCCLKQIQAFAALPPHVQEAIVANRLLTPKPAPVPAAVQEKFAQLQARLQVGDPESTASMAAANMAAAALVDAAVAMTDGGEAITAESGTVQMEGCDPIPLNGGAIFIDPSEGTP